MADRDRILEFRQAQRRQLAEQAKARDLRTVRWIDENVKVSQFY